MERPKPGPAARGDHLEGVQGGNPTVTEPAERPAWEGTLSGLVPSFVLLPGPLDISGPLAVAVRSRCLFREVFPLFFFFNAPPPFLFFLCISNGQQA